MSTDSPVTIHVRLKPSLAVPAAAIAEETGMSLPEILRTCFRAELARRAPVDEGNPYTLAAYGNLAALRSLTEQALNVAHCEHEEGNFLNSREALGAAIFAARLAAEHGEAFDQARLAGLFMLRATLAKAEGQGEFADNLDGDALAFLDVAAGNGSEIAANAMLGNASEMSAAAIARAKETRADIGAGR